MEEERDFVVFTDEDGTEFELDVLSYFEYEDEEYGILAELPGPEEDVDEEEDLEVYIMKIETDGEYEEFVPPDEDKMEALTSIAEKLLASMQGGCGCGEDCDCDGDCDCEGGTCSCGCHGQDEEEKDD